MGVEAGDSLGRSMTGETPQGSGADRGGSPHAPRKASGWNANQRFHDFAIIGHNTRIRVCAPCIAESGAIV